MKNRRILLGIVLVLLLMIPIAVYPVLGNRKAQEQEAAVTQVVGETSKEKDSGKGAITGQTILLGMVAATAGVLRYRHMRQMREKSWETAGKPE